MSSISTWEELRKAARKLEGELDLKLESYSKFGASFEKTKSSLLPEDVQNTDHVFGSMAIEIEQLLMKLQEINDNMSRYIARQDPSTATPLLHALQHHRGKLHDYTQEFKKLQQSIQSAREHAELLESVRRDINLFKSSGGSDRTDNLLHERKSLHASDRIADEVIGQAQQAREELHHQRSMLSGTLNKLKAAGAGFPAMGALMSAIKRKKSRDSIILALVISFCICFMLWYWLRT